MKKYYSNALNPIISGFYGDLHDPPHGVINQTLTCQVDSRMIPKLNTDEVEKFKEVWEFLRETYLRCYGCIDITPTYWWGTDQLKENIALRYLCTVSDRVFLFIDEPTKRVIGLNVLA
ncbi:hypothetical protein QS257_02345 [Terrilactibacillus sp. S3-3]|nr:hypothetical protein QS257_02345 [Terrilactibacillus sp. S3-3]